jgi:flavin reductase (DIM6/NTAB) family NADH-FMN oxidoreductase RutF
MVATAVHSFSADPASLLVSVNKNASVFDPLIKVGMFAVNVLRVQHAWLVPIFSGMVKGEERFLHGAWVEQLGIPVLSDAQASLCCRVVRTLEFGPHAAVVGVVVGVRVKEEIEPLLYQNGSCAMAVSLGAR